MKILWYHFLLFFPSFFILHTRTAFLSSYFFPFFFPFFFSPPHTYPYTFIFLLLSTFYPYHFLQTPERSSSPFSLSLSLSLSLRQQQPMQFFTLIFLILFFFSKFNHLQTGWFRLGRLDQSRANGIISDWEVLARTHSSSWRDSSTSSPNLHNPSTARWVQTSFERFCYILKFFCFAFWGILICKGLIFFFSP